MDQKQKNPYLVPIISAIALVLLCAFSKGMFNFPVYAADAFTAKKLIGDLVDCFTLPGVLLMGMSGLGWISTFGFFDIISYGSRSFFGIFIRPLAKDLPSTFYDYRMEKEEKGRKWSKELLIVGAVAMALAIILLIVYLIL